jgi:hypothetical protein
MLRENFYITVMQCDSHQKFYAQFWGSLWTCSFMTVQFEPHLRGSEFDEGKWIFLHFD